MEDTLDDQLERSANRLPGSYEATNAGNDSSQNFTASFSARRLLLASSVILQSRVLIDSLPVASSAEKSQAWSGANPHSGLGQDLLPELQLRPDVYRRTCALGEDEPQQIVV